MDDRTDLPDRRLEARAAQLKAADDWAGLCRELGTVDAGLLAQTPNAAYAYGEALYRMGRPDDLAAFAEVFETSARANSSPASTLRALNMAGVAAFELGDLDEATRRLDDVLEMAYSEGNHEMLAPAANNLGAIADLQGRTDEAVSYYRLALPLYEQAGRLHGVAQTHHNLGLSYRALRRVEDAIRSHEKTLEIAAGVGYRSMVALSLAARAECELDLGNVEIAFPLADRSIGIARDCEDPVSEGDALRVRGAVRSRQGHVDEALLDFEAAEEIAVRTSNSLLHAETLRDRGACLVDHAREDEGRPLLSQAAAELRLLGAVAKAEVIELGLPPEG